MDAARIDFIPPAVYSKLLSHLQRTRSMLSPTEAVACAFAVARGRAADPACRPSVHHRGRTKNRRAFDLMDDVH